tara:strand:- start:544 stop:984 length:441 start_codon:yes stop_codon:yes gene_type:complete
MFEDIVICEITHDDIKEKECCNPHQIIIGESNTGGILITMIFKDDDERKMLSSDKDSQLKISSKVIDNDKTEYKEKYDIQTGVEFTIQDQTEKYKMLIGSNGQNFHYFTNVPAINNTTDFGNSIFLSFPHTVEGFTYKDSNYKVFS